MTRTPKHTPAQLTVLRAKREVLENSYLDQIRRMVMLNEWPWGTPEQQATFMPSRNWRYDFCWRAHRLVVDIDGGTFSGGAHVRGAGFENDREKDAHAAIEGFAVLRFTGKQVKSGRAVELTWKWFRRREEQPR